MKYKPLDLSFLANQYSPRRDSIRNTAQMILANAGWTKPSQVSLGMMAKQQKAYEKAVKAQHHISPLTGFFDLLSAPLYGVANALDEAVAGHQSDPNDSVMEDAGQIYGGLWTGGAKGLGAGLRGGTAFADLLPGLDINDEWQSDPHDKTRFGDVAIRLHTGYKASDAMKPEHWGEIKPKLEKLQDKSWWDKSLSEMVIPDDLDREAYFKRQALTGIGADIIADPLNLVTFGGKSAATAARGVTEGLDTARGAVNVEKNILDGLKMKSGTKADKFFARPGAAADEIPSSPIGSVDEVGDLFNKGPVTSPVTSMSPNAVKGYKPAASLGARDEIPKAGLAIAKKDQAKLVSRISNMAAKGEKGWIYRAGALLRNHPEVQFTKTEQMLDRAESIIRRKGIRHNPTELAPALSKWIADDVAEARKVIPAERIVNTAEDVMHVPGKPKLKKSDAQIANRTIRQYAGQVFGKKLPAGIQSPEALRRSLASGNTVAYSGPKQANMWNTISGGMKFANTKKFDKTVNILRAVEDFYISKGAIPHSAAKTSESVPLRLSQVAEAIGPAIMGKSPAFITGILRGDPKQLAKLTTEQIQAIERLKASEAIASAPAVQKGIQAGKEHIDEILASKPMSAGRLKEALKNAPKVGGLTAATFGGGASGAKVAEKYIANALGKSNPVNKAMSANRLKTEAWLSKGALTTDKVNDIAFTKSVTNAISKVAGLPAPAQLGKIAGTGAKVKDWLGARFNAAYGVEDMRPIFLRNQASAMMTSARRAKIINELGRTFSVKDKDLWHEAFRAAQMNGITSGRVAELQSQLSKSMESLFGGTGLRSGALADSTVVGRSRLFMDELNSNLRRFGLGAHQFSNAEKVEDAAGVVHDFSKGANWLKSWEAWNVKDPYAFLHKVQTAVEHTVREKHMFDEIATRFGSTTKHGAVKHVVKHPRLAGIYFNAEGAQQAQQFIKIMDEVATPNAKSLQYLDHVISKIKAALTIYVPGHHWTNLIGDTYFNWIAGVNKPVRYEQAMKVMLTQKGRYGEFAKLENLTGPNAMKQAIARGQVGTEELAGAGLKVDNAAGNKVIIKMQNGTKITGDMIYTAMAKEGILPSARVLEEVISDVSSVLDKIRPLGGKGQRGVHKISEVRDHVPRIAQFIDGIAKSKQSFGAATQTSAARVRKWHPDGLDLTSFERNVMKRVFPFYSWTRKSIPLAIESAIIAGPKVMAYPRVMEALAIANGVESEAGPNEFFPTDQMFPDWLRDRGIGPISGSAGSYNYFNPSTPVLDTMSLLGHPGTSALDMLNPLAKVPLETASGHTLSHGIPIEDDYPNYLMKQIPAVSHVGRASGQYAVSDSTKEQGFPNQTNIQNILFGLRGADTEKYQRSAQFDLRDYFKKKQSQQG